MPICSYPNLMVPMRDGVRLATDVYLPDSHGRFPVILIRSPYDGCAARSADALEFCRDGIGMIIQDCRGTGLSEGEADLWRQESEDAEDFFAWLEQQEWFDGNLVTNGESYPGGCQWQAARLGHPLMKGLTPHNAPLDIYRCNYFLGGAFRLTLGMFWAFGMRKRRLHDSSPMNWTKTAASALPLNAFEEKIGMECWPLWQQWMSHPLYDEYWKKANVFQDIEKITVPAYITGGWYDLFLVDTLNAFSAMRTRAATGKARRFTRCVIEPLDHDMKTADLDYGPEHLNGIIARRNRFMKNILLHPDEDPLPGEPAMRFFVMGSNRWMETEEWPLKDTRDSTLHLHASAAANGCSGGGRLAEENSPDSFEGERESDLFFSNPLDPLPTAGGNNLGYTPNGQRLQTELEKRSDLLIYTGAILTEDLDLIGSARLRLYASCDCPDCDFNVKLCDVYPDGASYHVCDGVLRARFRHSPEKEELLQPGTVYCLTVDFMPTAMTFKKGHRLRLQIAGSSFPQNERNLHTGAPFGTDSLEEARIAAQTVYHSERYPSALILPVLPAPCSGGSLEQ